MKQHCFLRHRASSAIGSAATTPPPPPGFEDDDLLLVGDNLYYIHGSPTTHFLDVVHKPFKPSLHEAYPHLRPLQLSAGKLLSGGLFGFVSFRDLDVIGSFVKGFIDCFNII
jgi:hypothetical protein